MRTKKLKKAMIILFICIGSYLLIGHLFCSVIFPESKPDISTWFKPGQVLYSKSEGIKQVVLKQEKGFVHCKTVIEPYGAGPPKHIHTNFDETFEVENGELSIWVDGEVRKVRPGEKVHIPKGTPHKPYNETTDTIRFKGAVLFPEKFAFTLAQVYSVADNEPQMMASGKSILQMTLFQRSGLDAYAVDGPPVFMQKFTGFVLSPLSRMLGYKSYYKKYDPFVTPK